MCAGAFTPSRIGPTVTPWPPVTLSTLNRMFAASRFGSTSRFALPVSGESGIAAWRSASSKASSPCISPSAGTSGMRCANRSRAARILRADGRLLLP